MEQIDSIPNEFWERITYTPNEAAMVTGLSRATIYNLLRDGDLRRVKVGASTLIMRKDIVEFMDARVQKKSKRKSL